MDIIKKEIQVKDYLTKSNLLASDYVKYINYFCHEKLVENKKNS